ncbi:G2 and S phase-expressed protein 1 isoform X2 [Poeciliopsis prolifica]|uniref:G2 and S phase-expressed protein 1 isoform X2 n=1 Tax=Poeciliopsis prolifica TaxID=188132 RepID=UPI002413DE49|nr:G2 and S phase-expressed protein 1 isoform X2 [Poeciliopsis prolifica]
MAAHKEMNRGAHSDLCFLQDEKFDFDVSLSPVSSKGVDDDDDDEVFVGHTEQCVSTDVSFQAEEGGRGVQAVWTPLTADQLEAVCEEAHRLVSQLQCRKPHVQNTNTTHATSDADMNSMVATEKFTQNTEVKLGLLGHTASSLSPIKRQTFCVQDSPLRQLPPAIQHHLLRGSSSSRASSSRPAARRVTSSPMVGARSQARPALRGKTALGATTALPSKPVAPAGSRSAMSSGAEKTRLHPPSGSAGVLKRSPGCRLRNQAESSEDLLSDSVGMASDTSNCSFNSSLLGKHSLVPPSKDAGLRKLSGIKAPPVQGWKVTEKRKTSSSLSSLSSFNSSVSQSPATGKLNSSFNRRVSSSSGPVPSSVRREPGLSRPRRSTLSASAEPLSSRTGSRSQPSQAKKPPDTERANAAGSTPLKRAESTPVQPTPTKKTGSVGLRSGAKTRSKSRGLVYLTPKMADDAEGVSTVMKPKRLTNSSTESHPQKLSADSLMPYDGSSKLQQLAAQNPSTLPTLFKRRTFAFQPPSNQNRTFRPPFRSESSIPRTLSSAEKQQSPVPKGKQEEEPVHCPDIQAFCLEEEEEEPPVTLPETVSPETKQTQNTDLGMSKTVSYPVELEETEESAATTQEVLLLDLPPPSLQPQEKLLIDLANTPDLIRTSSKSCTTTQLIDLSSPLIKWSPEDKKENSALLINLSF